MRSEKLTISTASVSNAGLDFDPGRFRELETPVIMGVLNVTPDSFSDGGLYRNTNDAVNRAKMMIAEGASVIDVGGESTRPFSNPVTAEEEMERVFPVIRRLVREVNVPVSIDTRNVETAKACIEEGVSVINDVFGLRGKGMERLAVDREVTAVIMHMKGEPKVMQELPRYDDVVSEVRDFLRSRVERIVSIGGKKERLIIDPGIGFGKELRHNLELLNGLRSLTEIGCHVMVGVSRKSFIGKLLDTGVENRLEGSLAAALASVERGASVVRVHDVAATHRALVVQKAIMDPGSIGFIR